MARENINTHTTSATKRGKREMEKRAGMGNARDRRKRIRSKRSQTDSKFPTTYDSAPQETAPPCSFVYPAPFSGSSRGIAGKKFKFTPSSGSEGRSGQLTVALFSLSHAFSGSSETAIW